MVSPHQLPWHRLYYGPLKRADIMTAIRDEDWQVFRLKLKGKPLKRRFEMLLSWVEVNRYSKDSKIQVTNYVTALSRAGLIKPEHYLKKEE